MSFGPYTAKGIAKLFKDSGYRLYMVKDAGDGDEILKLQEVADTLGYIRRDPRLDELTISDVANALDMNAESHNHHAFVNVHASLIPLPSMTLELMLEIARCGGLHRME